MADHSEEMSRRRFFHRVVVAVGGIIGTLLGLPIVSYFLSPALEGTEVYADLNRLSRPKWLTTGTFRDSSGSTWTAVAGLSEIPSGQPIEKAYAWRRREGWMTTSGRSSVWLVKKEETLTAFDPHCTHLGCPYSWSEEEQMFLCPCHDAAFDINGYVVKGPPPRPLDRYEIKVEDGKVLIGELIKGDEA